MEIKIQVKTKLEVGMFVRTEKGIAKIIGLEENPLGEKTIYRLDKEIIYTGGAFGLGIGGDYQSVIDTHFEEDIEQVIKASFNIIDLIEVGDIITTNNLLGEITKIDVEKDMIWVACCDYEICHSQDIETVVTKEQFKNIEYEVK